MSILFLALFSLSAQATWLPQTGCKGISESFENFHPRPGAADPPGCKLSFS